MTCRIGNFHSRIRTRKSNSNLLIPQIRFVACFVLLLYMFRSSLVFMRFLVLSFQSSGKFRPSGSGQFDFVKNYGPMSDLSSSFVDDESQLDANSEKEQVLLLKLWLAM